MEFSTELSPHLESRNSVPRVMLQVLLALLPGIATMTWFYGFGVIINLVLASTVALAAESVVMLLRGRPVFPALADLSAIVTAILLALAIPPLTPWWVPSIGTLFAILIAKHMYGGLGYNPFNPAMIGYVVLLISFPQQMSLWLAPDLSLGLNESWQIVFGQYDAVAFDGMTSATVLDTVRTGLSVNQDIASIQAQPVYEEISHVSFSISFAYLLGGIWLLSRNVIGWQIPVGMLSSLFLLSSVFCLIDSGLYPGPLFHLFAGATMLGAFFIATDPVTAATSTRGRLIYGILIGILIFVIRSWGGYPDAVAFAVLLINLAVPTIDYYTRPRVFGHS